ncbi:MAG: endolytic transglycosylase MltG [Pseudomonadota bacterium]
MKKALLVIFVLFFSLFGYFYYSMNQYAASKISLEKDEVYVTIPKGATLNRIIRILTEHGLIQEPIKFKFLANILGYANKLQAGDFLLEKSYSNSEFLEFLSKAQNLQFKIVIPEGLNMYEIAELLDKNMICDKLDFLSLCQNEKLLTELNIENSTVEGYLFPNTYLFHKKTDPELIIKRLNKELNDRFSQELLDQMARLNFTKNKTLTLASIIEKETGQGSERSLISSVFHNRLEKNIRLQSDPTVIYGIWSNFDGNIKKSDLNNPTPFNTYTNNGLPPSPIANPGIESIMAALYPEKTDYLYFVSKNDGSHFFSVNLKDHINAVNRYQKKVVSDKL